MTGENGPPDEPTHESTRAKKQRLVRHAFERAAALSTGTIQLSGCDHPEYRRVWSHRLEQLAELGVHRLIHQPDE